MSDKLEHEKQEEKQRIVCKICSCEGVDGTVLCREHLEGFLCAVKLLQHSRLSVCLAVANSLIAALKPQQKPALIIVPGGIVKG